MQQLKKPSFITAILRNIKTFFFSSANSRKIGEVFWARLKQISSFTISIGIVVSSCSVEKRVYMTGFNVKWNRAIQDNHKQRTYRINNKELNTDAQKVINVAIPSKSINSTLIDTNSSADNTITTSIDKSIFIATSPKYNLGKKVSPSYSGKINKFPILIKHNNPDNKKVHPLAIVGFIFSILGFNVLLIVGAVLGIVFSAIALHQINNNPDIYKGKELARWGLFIGIATLIFAILLVLTFLFLALLILGI